MIQEFLDNNFLVKNAMDSIKEYLYSKGVIEIDFHILEETDTLFFDITFDNEVDFIEFSKDYQRFIIKNHKNILGKTNLKQVH